MAKDSIHKLSIYLTIEGKQVQKLEVSQNASNAQVQEIIRKAADVSDAMKESTILKLYRSDGVCIPIGANLSQNSSSNPYCLRIRKLPENILPVQVKQAMDSLEASKGMLSEINEIKKSLTSMKVKVDQLDSYNGAYRSKAIPKKPAMARVEKSVQSAVDIYLPPFTITPEICISLKDPAIDVWKYSESELIHLLVEMYRDLELLDTYKIEKPKLIRFLQVVRQSYNQNPFHNFRHCFCVSQMMYSIINISGVRDKLSHLEKLVLITSTIGHDLDHPGTNNAYQVNAGTDLARIYNDSSPLENHHSAVLFSILNVEEFNFLSLLNPVDWKEFRRLTISCILATDMAKHGEIMTKFKGFAENMNYEDANQKQTLLMMIIKCSDISNEVRPTNISEKWVDGLLDEFFTQSDREKIEGLPVAPFMDRQKVTKPSAQVGFIGFVMIPLFDLLSKALPNMKENFLDPIKKAQEYYQSLLDASKKT